MPYRFKKGETAPDAVRRIVREEIDSTLAELSHTGARLDEGVHEARKSIKKIRGLIRLVRAELGPAYRSANTSLGEIGRKLSEIRDTTAVLESLDSLAAKHKDALQENALAPIRKGLETDKREIERRIGIPAAVKRAASALRVIRKKVDKWPLQHDGFRALAPGLEDRYRRGRKAMATAQKDETPESFHEWRKRVKDHWYHIRLLESLWTGVMQAYEGSLHDLETWLGDDHNLVVLREKLEAAPDSFGGEQIVQLFLALVGQEQQELREKAVSLGERVYERKPRRLVQDTEKLWDAWRQEPASMKAEEKAERQTAKKRPARAASSKKTAAA
ncbi:MAG: CHAD domain-containing protein [Acidobacteriaceae bacterium]|nr:CHAD domain-containing protein [Acidobacteriaceae bacterium]